MTETNETPIFVDTHAHLDDGRFDRDVDDVLNAAARAGVTRVVNVGYRPLRWRTTLALAKRRPEVAFSLGLHPHHAEEWSPAVAAELERRIAETRPVALGEIGLDYFRDFADRGAQRRAFAAQLDLAQRVGLPVVIHMRGEVETDLRAELDQAGDRLVCILHSFDGSENLAADAVSRGYLFGVGGLVTKRSNGRLRAIVAELPLERLLLETDAPYLTPAGVKDRRNAPANIPLIASALAELRSTTTREIAAATTATAERVFGLSSAANLISGEI